LPNPHFLDARFFRDAVLAPSDAAFLEHQGPYVFQMLPLPPAELPNPEALIAKLDRFLGQLPTHAHYAVEIRNPQLLTPSYFAALARHNVAHVFTAWSRMPTIGSQLAHPGSLTADFAVCRLNLPTGADYEQRREAFAPFNAIVAPDPAMRDDVAQLVGQCAALGKTIWVTVNNKAEGSSPLTVRALLQKVAGVSKRA
jgi:uncharacterized protein YecE (DUF72 family)